MSCEDTGLGQRSTEVTESQSLMEQSECEWELSVVAEAKTTTEDDLEQREDSEEATESSEEDEDGQCTSRNREIAIKRVFGRNGIK